MFDPSTTLRSRAWVEVRLDQIRANACAVQRAVGSDVGLIPMVKANAYGLGLAPVVRTLAYAREQRSPWAFGVAAVAEGEALRDLGWTGRVLIFAPALPDEFPRAAAADLTLCLSDIEGVRDWARVAARCGRVLPFHIEVDTGMGRAGFAWDRTRDWAEDVVREARDRLAWEGCYTHFHSADEPDLAATDRQWERFERVLASLPEPVKSSLIVHVANSAAALRRGAFGCFAVRPGIFLYGGAAGAGTAPRPVVAVRARLALIREVPEGWTAGYGATYSARRPERWGTLAIGYGDGVPRSLWPGGGEVIIRGRRVPIIGRISMDMVSVDLTELPEARVGDVATLIGSEGDQEITLDEVAARCGTISYEILTGLTTRLPRLYGDSDGALVPDEVSG